MAIYKAGFHKGRIHHLETGDGWKRKGLAVKHAFYGRRIVEGESRIKSFNPVA